MTPCHACPEAAGPSGWCARHRSILAARLGRYAYTVPVADAVAVAQHPGWRGRKWRLVPRMWEDGLFFHASPKDGTGPGYKTAAEALYDVDFRNGIPVADLSDLRKRLAEVERERDDARAKLTETADLCRELDEGVTIVCGERNAYKAERDAARAEASDLRAALARSQEYATVTGETLRADLAAARSDADTLRARLDRYRAAIASLAVALVLAVVAAVGLGVKLAVVAAVGGGL